MAASTRTGKATGRARGCAGMAGQGGFTYIGVLLAVAVMGLVLASFGTAASVVMQRERETELLFVGDQFRRAIASYYHGTPGPIKRYPARLEDLLEDRRGVAVVRHLRKMYRDPITGTPAWGLVHAPDGSVAGVYSQSIARPRKQANFREADIGLGGADSYMEWHFVFTPTITQQ